MVSNISFGNTYKVSTANNSFNNFWDFQNFAHRKEMEDGVVVRMTDTIEPKHPHTYKAVYTMVAPDSMDREIETYCAAQGIEYKRFETNNLLDTRTITDRISAPANDKIKASINVEKLEKLIKNQNSNIKHCEKDYYSCYYDDVDFAIKSADEIDATTLEIYYAADCYKPEEALAYIEKYGKDNLNKNQFFIDFSQQTDKPDHCTYFALRDLGMNNIPVYVDNNTFKIGKALGILE